ncbi:MAG: hypothetical protein ABEH40_03845 [Haloferacaceae archaeon]
MALETLARVLVAVVVLGGLACHEAIASRLASLGEREAPADPGPPDSR